jgi:RNA polymerase sigma-70 factor, ECF subfamily
MSKRHITVRDASWSATLAERPKPARAVGGDTTLRFERLIAPHLRDASALAQSIAHDRASGEDALQNAALNAWRKLDQLRDDASARAWFLTIVVNECRSAGRRRWLLTSSEEQRPGEEWPEKLDERADVRRAMQRLRTGDRVVLSLRYLLDMSIDEVARVLQVSPSAVKARTARALQRFQALLTTEGGDVTNE